MTNELILLVEDDEMNRKLVREVLRFKGYRTLEAVNGEEGVALAAKHRPDLILMDYQLPGIDGIEAFRRIRDAALTSHIPIVAVTASAMPEQARMMKEAGFDGFQSKPINVRKLMEFVSKMLSGKVNKK